MKKTLLALAALTALGISFLFSFLYHTKVY